mmetsp:Transcript_47520/g.108316  ORF Transcript_47520/g.108316 Transcript_47520/m.108316 type:complete len:106 (-) Transcript_47520:33-350(-)
MLKMMIPLFGGSVEKMVTMVKPMITGMCVGLSDVLVESFDPGVIDVAKVRKELDGLMTEKLELLTPEMVKALLEEVIREHLGWLVVWGNVFGGLIGVIALAAGYK